MQHTALVVPHDVHIPLMHAEVASQLPPAQHASPADPHWHLPFKHVLPALHPSAQQTSPVTPHAAQWPVEGVPVHPTQAARPWQNGAP